MDFSKLLKPIFLEGLDRALKWYKSDDCTYLWSIFDQVGFKDRDKDWDKYLALPVSLSARVPYPVKGHEASLKAEKDNVLKEINESYKGFSQSYLNSLNSNQLLFLLEKFGSYVPFDKTGIDSIFDAYKIKAAREVIRSNRFQLNHNDNLLINVDLSGIQNFIYTIASAGALKNLRSRSFFIELLSNHTIYKVLTAFNLHYVNILMNGGGSVIVISSCPANYEEIILDLDYGLNKWLLKEFGGTLSAAFAVVKCSDENLEGKIPELFRELSSRIFIQKNRKFSTVMEKGEFPFCQIEDPKYLGCDVCSRDNPDSQYVQLSREPERFRCSFCNRLVSLGNKIPRARFIYKCDEDSENSLKIEDISYLISEHKTDLEPLWIIFRDETTFIDDISEGSIAVFGRSYIKRNIDLPPNVRGRINIRVQTLTNQLAASVAEEEKQLLKEEIESLYDENIATLEYIAESSEGAKLIGALRMDADNVGKILQYGFYETTGLEKLSSFSRNINYFFRFFVPSVCQNGLGVKDDIGLLDSGNSESRNVHLIYSGGDDLFILGSWSDAAELAVNIGQAFKNYSCNNIDIGLSGGLTVHSPNFPAAKMADESKAALNLAKGNHQACWMCRKEWTTCPLYDVGDCLRKESLVPFFSEYMLSRKRYLDQEYKAPKYSQESTRLKLALKWKKYDPRTLHIVDEISEYIVRPLKVFTKGTAHLSVGFFHKINVLLDIWYEQGVLYLPKAAWVLEKFRGELQKQKIDRESDQSLYDLCETYMHFLDNEYDIRFSTLHIPLSWVILKMRGGNWDDET